MKTLEEEVSKVQSISHPNTQNQSTLSLYIEVPEYIVAAHGRWRNLIRMSRIGDLNLLEDGV